MAYTATEWDEHINTHQGHLLQSWAWGQLKGQFHWTPIRLQVGQAVAQVLIRHLVLGLSLAYIPKGPVIDWTDTALCRELFAQVQQVAQKERAIFLKVEPNLEDDSSPQSQAALHFLAGAGFSPAETIQPGTTLVIDIRPYEEEILARMKQKTRYNIRLAGRKDVIVRQGSEADVNIFHKLSRITASRDKFHAHSLAYYRAAYRLFAPDRCALLIAEYRGQPLAALMAFCHGPAAYYLYGASSNRERNRMPTYLLQWEAIRWAKSRGCTHYDLWGIPDADLATLEEEFQQRHDGLWGVYRFKRGFGGRLACHLNAFDYPYITPLYQLYCLRQRLVKNN